MARVLVATQAWGIFWQPDGPANTGGGFQVKLPAEQVATINTTVYAGPTGTTQVSLPWKTDTNGVLPGWVEEGDWILTINGVPFAVEAVSGTVAGRIADLEATLADGLPAGLDVGIDNDGDPYYLPGGVPEDEAAAVYVDAEGDPAIAVDGISPIKLTPLERTLVVESGQADIAERFTNVFTPEGMVGITEIERITAAISAAEVVRGRVEFQRGKTYTLPTPTSGTATFQINSEMTLDFNGAKIVVDTTGVTTYKHLIKIGTAATIAENVTIRNGQFDGLLTARVDIEPWTWIVPHHVRNFVIEDCLFDRSKGDGVANGEQAVGIVDGLTMRNCVMRRCNGQLVCVASAGSTSVRIEGCRFSEHLNLDVEGGAGTAPEAVFLVYVEHVTVTGCVFTTSGPIAVYGASDVTITGNVVKTNGYQQGAVSVANLAVDQLPTRVTITGNVFDTRYSGGNGHAGVFVDTTNANGAQTVISSNVIRHGAKSSGIQCNNSVDTVITGNLVTGGDGTVAVAADIVVSGNNATITGNRCKSPGCSISTGGTWAAVSGNTVSGCIASSAARTTITGNTGPTSGTSSITGSVGMSIETFGNFSTITGNNVAGIINIWGKDCIITGNVSSALVDVVAADTYAMRNRYGLNVPQATGLHATSTQPS